MADGHIMVQGVYDKGNICLLYTSLASHVLEVWRGYTDEAAFIFAETEGEPHNTITPIARKVGEMFELDLTLRNNITTEEHPLGVYHPHAEYHHIKKENIGLIEVMGLAVLPARLKEELELLEMCIRDRYQAVGTLGRSLLEGDVYKRQHYMKMRIFV